MGWNVEKEGFPSKEMHEIIENIVMDGGGATLMPEMCT